MFKWLIIRKCEKLKVTICNNKMKMKSFSSEYKVGWIREGGVGYLRRKVEGLEDE